MKRELVKAVVILPGTALVYVPGALVWLTAGLPSGWAPAGTADSRFWIGVALAVPGFALAVWTVRLFVTVGEGTPAPWAPPRKLVVRGPYRHVRNPMLSAVNVMLAAEALLFGSWYVAGWMAVFVVLNTAYFVRGEEPALEERFGESYRLYKANVPRWMPRWKPWDAP